MLLKKGSKGDEVKKLQERLGLKADGDFGAITETKVKAWQTANGLKADGVVGDITWVKLFPPEAAIEEKKPVAVTVAAILLKKGSNGDDVKKLQARLGLKADGDFGAITEAKVKAWQAANGLKADGVVGNVTWNKLFATDTVIIEEASTAPVNLNVTIKIESLKGHIPDNVIAQLPEAMAKFNITNILRLAHFLSQCGHESASFKLTTENLNYSASRLKAVFPKYFKSISPEAYAYNPAKLGSRVYANRMGNGNEASGDGYKYRGRGYIQLTGKDNYTRFAKFIGEDTVVNPDLVATKYPLASAAFFFDVNHLWSICDAGATNRVVTNVTKRVNGGTHGLDDRLARFETYYAALTR